MLREESDYAPLFANEAAAQMFGFEYAFEALALPCLGELIPPELHADEVLRSLAAAVQRLVGEAGR